MRSTGLILAVALATLGAILGAAKLAAAERALAIRTGELKQQPFIDAARAGAVAANQAVSVVARQGGWVRVESNGQNGWLRMLNVRLQVAAPAAGTTPGASNGPSRGSVTSPASLFHTGSTGRTVTTGVKGLDESDIRNSTPNREQVAVLDSLADGASDASAHAVSSGLREQNVEYLTKGRR